MKIKQSSWHYRLLEAFSRYPSRSLCGYFWQVVSTLLLYVPVTILFIGALVGILGFMFLMPIFSFFGIFDISSGGYIGLLLWAFVLFAYLEEKYSVITNLHEKWEDRSIRKEYKEKDPNIFFEWLKAKKSKVCPMLEFVREDQK